MDWSSIGSSAVGSGLDTGGQLGSSLINSYVNSVAQARTQGFNLWESDTAHQREVADLKAAGLNPILSATGGSGAGSPQAVAPKLDVDMGQPGSKFISNLQAMQGIENSKADIGQKHAAAANLLEQSNTELTRQSANNAAALRDSRYADLLDGQAHGQLIDNIRKVYDSEFASSAAGRQAVGLQLDRLKLAEERVKKGLCTVLPVDEALGFVHDLFTGPRPPGISPSDVNRSSGKLFKTWGDLNSFNKK